MKSKRNILISNTIMSIGFAAAVFIVIGMIFDIRCSGNLQMMHYSFSRMAAGALAVGLGFGIPTSIYENEKLSLLVQTLIHMGIGCAVLTVTAFLVGWLPTDKGVFAMIGALVGEIVISFVIWRLFYVHQKKLAQKMNRRIKDKTS